MLRVFNEELVDTAADLTGDGLTDLADLAILTGNFEVGCDPVPETTPEVTPETTEDPVEITPEGTDEPVADSTATEIIQTEERITPSPEITPEVTAETEGSS